MDNALFDKITNSEDEMILRAGIPRNKACTYLRAYIMASLCFEKNLVISDTSVSLNKAFRTLIDYDEGAEYKLEDLPQKADFHELIGKGHIRFAARDIYRGNFSDALRKPQEKMKRVDKPSEQYIKLIDSICSDKYVYWYNLDRVSRKFTSNFKYHLNHELYDNPNTIPEDAKLLQKLIRRLSDEEKITYNGVKSILLDEYHYSQKDDSYKYIRRLLRDSYDNNIPNLLGLDYCMSLNGIKPSRKQSWKLELSNEQELDYDFVCDIYGLAKLKASRLKYIWGSPECKNWEKQLTNFGNGTINPNEYIEVLNKYLRRINDEVRDFYTPPNRNNYSYNKGILKKTPIKICHYYKSDDIKVVIAKLGRDACNIGNFIDGYARGFNPIDIFSKFFLKMFPVLIQRTIDFPDPPEEIGEAIVLQKRTENKHHVNIETK